MQHTCTLTYMRGVTQALSHTSGTEVGDNQVQGEGVVD